MMISMDKNGKFLCLYCRQRFDDKDKAEEHYINHEIIYLPIATEDLNALVNFIYSREEKLLEGKESMIKLMQRYLKERVRKT